MAKKAALKAAFLRVPTKGFSEFEAFSAAEKDALSVVRGNIWFSFLYGMKVGRKMPCFGPALNVSSNQLIIQKSDRLINVFPAAFGAESFMTTGYKAVSVMAEKPDPPISRLVSTQWTLQQLL